jgi:pSer/pThr/pTyr-binding forkhead associated (FHA) protein
VVSSSPIGQPYFRIAQSDQSIEFPAGKTSFLIGRQDPESEQFPEMDLEAYNAHIFGVGRKHARITIHNGQVYLEDFDSVNGTMINQSRILPARPTLLNDGDEVRLGKMILIFCKG